MEAAVITLDARTAIQAQEYETDAVVEAFIAEQDCHESSRRLYKRTIKQYFAWVRRTGRMLNAMTRADIIAYREGLINGTATEDGQPRSSLTAASYLTAVKLFYKWLHETDGSIANIAKDIKLPKREKKFEREPLTPHEAAELTAQTGATASVRDNAIVNLLLRTGMRTIEAVRANVEDLQIRSGQVVLLVQGKGHDSKDNFVIVSEAARTAIAAYMSTRPDAKPTEPLFISDSHRNAGGRLTTRTISGIVKDNLKAIGLDSRSYTAHSLRHTFACGRLEQTKNYHLVQKEMRHVSPATTDMYTYHMEQKERIEAAQQCSIDNLY